MRAAADSMHRELLDSISNLSDGTISDRASSVCLLCYCAVRTLNFSFVLVKLDVPHTEQLSNKVLRSDSHHAQLTVGLSSSKSFSMLPARPQIFHGRESELTEIVRMLQQEYAKIAILGAGGMGKTSICEAR